MSTPMNTHTASKASNRSPLSLLKVEQVKGMTALMLIGTAIFFFLAYRGLADWTSPWWMMYVAIPSVVLLYAAGAAFFEARKVNALNVTDAVLGLLGIALTVIMIKDPTWSFTRNTELDRLFPVLRQVHWDPVWQWLLVVLGGLSVVLAVYRRVIGIGVLGAFLITTGLTFYYRIHWDYVWPVFVLALGAGLLLQMKNKK